jgi:TatD DNase family protein
MIDTHCHIDLYPNPTQIADRANRAGILTVLVTNLPSAFQRAYPHIKQFQHIRLALGLHPLVAEDHQEERRLFSRLIDKTSYIGEIGLDFSREVSSTKEIQIESFKFVLQTLQNRRKFITLHSRRAESTVLKMLDDSNYDHPVVFHWYSGNLADLEDIVKGGHFFSINPAMTVSPNGKKIIERIPPERILTESDGPFVKSQGKVVEPKSVSEVEKYLAALWSIESSRVRLKIRNNFLGLVSPLKGVIGSEN